MNCITFNPRIFSSGKFIAKNILLVDNKFNVCNVNFTFPECRNLYLHNNDKRFINQYFHPHLFPLLKNVLIDRQHMFNKSVLQRFPNVLFSFTDVGKYTNRKLLK